MPVDSSRVVLELVVDSDLENITPVAFYQRPWNLAVDSKSHLGTTSIEVYSGVRYGKFI